ncbi:hypothetical protein CRU98_13245 [Arcobacter sp. CECT 8986]|uniref:hypothetical protein n=1 Tax=Arcobacter sp. CECT 8986 TaxID=2044507 RepID=UPI001009FB0E|nr:hypothetical protein [Arcobacter sp. CECT 8986]RXJ97593.1 hypothetical protein CRU98_13245 [Arcobacter sp. CECT 8986]
MSDVPRDTDLDLDEDFDIYAFINSLPVAKEVFNSCFRQDRKKYYFSKRLLKFEVVENEKQLISLVVYDFPKLKKVEYTKTGKEIITTTLPKDFFDITFFVNTIDMIKTKVDPFQREKVIFKRFDRTLELITNELLIKETRLETGTTEETYETIIEDYKEHFKDLDKFLDWIIACRFTNNRRSSYLHFWVEAGFGKSFLSACFKECGIVTECRYEDFKSPSSLSPFELRNSWIILIDEFTIFKKEFKNLTNELIVDAKNQLRTIVDVYAKVFLSAEQSPSFEDGVDKQITDRVQQIRTETIPLEKREKYINYGNALYLQCVSRYIYLYLKKEIKKYISRGKIGADKKATKTLNEFLEEYRLNTDILDDVLYQLFYNKIFDIRNEEDFDSLSRNDQIIKREHIFERKDKTFVLHNVKKVFTLIIEQEDSNFYKKAQYKTNGIDIVLKVKKEDIQHQYKIGKGNKRGLLINPLDFYYDENAGKYKKLEMSKEDKEKFEKGELF